MYFVVRTKYSNIIVSIYVAFFTSFHYVTQQLVASNPGTIANVEWTQDPLIQGQRCFHRCVVCPHVSNGVIGSALPVASIDGAHLKGMVKGVVLVFGVLRVNMLIINLVIAYLMINICFALDLDIGISFY